MAQQAAVSPASAPIVDWETEISNLNSRIFTAPIAGEETIVVSPLNDVTAYEHESGNTRWRLSESAVDTYRRITGTSHRDGSIVFAGTNERTRGWEVVAVDSATGSEQWTVELSTGDTEDVRAMVVSEDRAAVVTADNSSSTPQTNIVLVDLANQSVSWKAQLGQQELNPEDLALGDERLVVTTDEAAADSDNVVVFDLANRERVWSRQFQIGEAIPVINNGYLYLPTEVPVEASGFSGLRSLSLEDGSERWRFEFQNPPRTGVTIDDNRVYAVGGNTLYAITAEDGEGLWSYTPSDDEPSIGGTSSELPVATQTHLLLGSRGRDSGVVRAVEKSSGKLDWTLELPYQTVFSPFIVDDHLYTFAFDRAGNTGTLYSLH
jgi:outer membrane protein assembly factor BamB